MLLDSSGAIAASEGRPKPGKTKSVWEMTVSVLMGNQGGGSKEGCSEDELGTYLRSVLLSKTSSEFLFYFIYFFAAINLLSADRSAAASFSSFDSRVLLF